MSLLLLTVTLVFEACSSIDDVPAPAPGPPRLQLKLEKQVDDHIYTMRVNVGNEPIDLVIDTGSSFLWVANDSLTRSQYYKHPGYHGEVCNKCNYNGPRYGYNISLKELTYHNWQDLVCCDHPKTCECQPSTMDEWIEFAMFNPSIQAYVANCSCDEIYHLNYAVGNITGYSVTDQISINQNRVSKYEFGVAMSDSTYISAFAGGVFGLSYPATAHQIPPLDALYPNDSDIFSLYFGVCPVLIVGDPPKKTADRYYYKDYYTEIDLIGKTNATYFAIYVCGIGFYQDYNFSHNLTTKVYIDSGTSFLVAPESFDLNKTIQESFKCGDCVFLSEEWSGIWEIDPSKINGTQDLPTLSIYYGMKPNERWDLEWCHYIFTEKDMDNKTHYLIGITTLPNLDYWVLGDMFLQKFFVTFDKRHGRLGIAPAKGRKVNTNPNVFCKKCYNKNHCKCKEWPKDDYVVDKSKDPCKPRK